VEFLGRLSFHARAVTQMSGAVLLPAVHSQAAPLLAPQVVPSRQSMHVDKQGQLLVLVRLYRFPDSAAHIIIGHLLAITVTLSDPAQVTQVNLVETITRTTVKRVIRFLLVTGLHHVVEISVNTRLIGFAPGGQIVRNAALTSEVEVGMARSDLFFLFLIASFVSTASLGDAPTIGSNGTFARFADQNLTGVKIPSGTSDTLICDPELLLAAKDAGLGSGERCIKFINDDTTGVNYIPLKPSGFVSFLEYFRNHPLRDACEVDPNPWMGWSGEAPQACGITSFEQSNTCIERSFVCGGTCPQAPDGAFKIYRDSPVEGYCCDPDSYSSQTGLTEAQTAASCTFPDTIAFEEISECGVARTSQLTCGGCGTHDWTLMDGVSRDDVAKQCVEGELTYVFLKNGCGAIKKEPIDCTG